jgi:hypothetical protein
MRFILPFAALACALAACSPAPTATDQSKQQPPVMVAPTDATMASVTAPLMGSHNKSPLAVSGIAPNNWYFEASFPVTLIGPDGQVIAQMPAQAQSDWTVQGPVLFKAQLNFVVLRETQATLVLREDMPGENNPMPREVRIPVVLEPPG